MLAIRMVITLVLLCVLVEAPIIAQPVHQQLFDQGLAFARQGAWDQAIACLKESYETHPHSMTAYVLSVAYAKSNDADSALMSARRAIEGNPPLPARFREGAVEVIRWAAIDKEARSRLPAVRVEMSVPNQRSQDLWADIEDLRFISMFIDEAELEMQVQVLLQMMECVDPQLPSVVRDCMRRLFAGEEVYALPSAPEVQLPESPTINDTPNQSAAPDGWAHAHPPVSF